MNEKVENFFSVGTFHYSPHLEVPLRLILERMAMKMKIITIFEVWMVSPNTEINGFENSNDGETRNFFSQIATI